jgi:PAS domain S-box-containing protein
MKSNTSGPMALKILLLAVAYVITGRLALLLAIPPGFVTAIFPPVGIGLAAVLLWGNPMLLGVLLGSTALNLSMSISSGTKLSATSFLLAFGIAVGSSIHNAVSAAMIRKYIGFPSALDNERQVIGFLIIGAPLASLISATWGTSVLYLTFGLSVSEYAFSWWTWWVGDGIGVLIAAPLTLILFAEPRHLWRRRRMTVGLPLLIGCALMVVAFIRASRMEHEGITSRFNESAQLITARIKANLRACADIVLLVERFMTVAPQSTRADFGAFSNEVRAAHPELQAMGWLARVRKNEREAIEQALQADSFPVKTIWERNEANQIVQAPERDEHLVITFVEPIESHARTVGFDFTSEPIRSAAVAQARDNDSTVLTEPVELLIGGSKGARLLLVQPVYSGSTNSLAERRQNFRGVINAVIDPEPLVQTALIQNSLDDYRVHLDDVTDSSRVLGILGRNDPQSSAENVSFQFEENWSFASRSLAITILPTKSFLQKNRSMQSWVILAGGLALCGMLGAFMLIVSGRTNHIEQLVTQRTLELSAILDNASEAIVTFHANGYIERANPASANLFGYSMPALLGKRFTDLIPQFDLNAKQTEEALEVRGYRHDGTALLLEMTLSHMEVRDRKLFTAMMHDISARKKAEQLKNEFVSTVSHELRTPLTSISGSIGLICGGVMGEVSAEVRELLDIARVNSERLTLLVNDILDIEKIAAGKLEVTLNRWDLRVIVDQSLVQIRGYAEQHGISVVLEEARADAVPAMVYADASRLLQVMANLLSNAIKFSPKQGQVEVSLTTTNENVKVTVRDHGPGVPKDFRERIFAKFAQADSADTRARGGTGLGLSISKALIEKFGGTIGFDDAPGDGSVFFFELPLVSTTEALASQT